MSLRWQKKKYPTPISVLENVEVFRLELSDSAVRRRTFLTLTTEIGEILSRWQFRKLSQLENSNVFSSKLMFKIQDDCL